MQHPLSSPIAASEQDRFAGSWLSDESESLIHVAFQDDRKGRLGRLDWEQGDFRLAQGELFLTELHGRRILSMRMQKDGKWIDRYFFAQYAFTDQGYLIIWPPKVSAFEQAVTDKLLKGEITRGKYETHVLLTGRQDDILDFIKASNELFGHQNPIVLRKITRIKTRQNNQAE